MSVEVFSLRLDGDGQPVSVAGHDEADEVVAIAVSQLDALGELSAEAQFLRAPITSMAKWRGTDHVVVVAVDVSARRLVGYLKYGRKDLYFYSRRGVVRPFEQCLCLLDFYVLEAMQRGGLGRALCDAMLSGEGARPHEIAYDRPSPKLLPFLDKHYALTGADAQPNRFTIFAGFLPADQR